MSIQQEDTFHWQTGLKFKGKLVKYHTRNIYGTETWTLWKVGKKYLKYFEMWCWRRMEVIWTNRVGNEVLQRVKAERNVLHTLKKRKVKWIGHILHQNCLLKHITEGKLEGRREVRGR